MAQTTSGQTDPTSPNPQAKPGATIVINPSAPESGEIGAQILTVGSRSNAVAFCFSRDDPYPSHNLFVPESWGHHADRHLSKV